MAEFVASTPARARIHSSSVHANSLCAATTDTVSGGVRVRLASGSALSTRAPSAVWMAYLYVAPSSMPGMKISHNPDAPRERIGYWFGFHSQKSPMTATPCALGAHTANEVPRTSPREVS